MSRPTWILCERSNDWGAALRKAVQRCVATDNFSPHLKEVRSLSDLAVQLDERPNSFVLIEAHRANFADVLNFLSEAGRRYSHSCIAALVDYGIAPRRRGGSQPPQADMQIVVEVLLEAGAIAVIDSPRRLHGLLDVARRHQATRAERARTSPANFSLVEQAWASLPWQDK